MDFYYDCEFREDGRVIDPISIGIVAGDGRALYREIADTFYDQAKVAAIRHHPWLMEHVVPNLSPAARGCLAYRGGLIEPSGDFRYAWQVAQDVATFIRGYGSKRTQHRLYAWCGAYDHVMLAQLFGPMIQLPSCIPMFTYDLKAMVGEFEDETGRRLDMPPEPTDAHNAVADATWNWQVREALEAAKADGRGSAANDE